MTYLMAVYGTLRKNYGNHHYLKNADFIGLGKTINKYRLRARGIPFVDKTPNTHITIELYSVNDVELANIDRLEGHPTTYKRELTEVKVNDTIYNAWLYFYNHDLEYVTEINDGDYKTYLNTLNYDFKR